jgi:hypothetical protein
MPKANKRAPAPAKKQNGGKKWKATQQLQLQQTRKAVVEPESSASDDDSSDDDGRMDLNPGTSPHFTVCSFHCAA